MKAIVRLDNNFEIDGLIVKSNDNETLYTWGCTPHEGCYCKTIGLDHDEKKTLLVMSLIRMNEELKAVHDIPTDFMFNSISREQNDVIRAAAEKGKCNAGYNVQCFMNRESELKTKIKETIQLFK